MSRTLVFFLVIGTLGLATLLTTLGAMTLPNLMGLFLFISGLIYLFGVLIFIGSAALNSENEWTPQFHYWRRPQKMEDGGANLND